MQNLLHTSTQELSNRFHQMVLDEAFGSQEYAGGSTPCPFVSKLSKNSLHISNRFRWAKTTYIVNICQRFATFVAIWVLEYFLRSQSTNAWLWVELTPLRSSQASRQKCLSWLPKNTHILLWLVFFALTTLGACARCFTVLISLKWYKIWFLILYCHPWV